MAPSGICLAEDLNGHEELGGHDGSHHRPNQPGCNHLGFHPHHIAVFLGLTEAEHHHETIRELTLGLDYEYRCTKYLGLGGLVDYSGGDLDTTVIAVALFIHPVANLKLLIAPGYELHSGHEEELVRAGVGWDFHAGESLTITPTFSVDFVSSEEIKVYGIAVGWGF